MCMCVRVSISCMFVRFSDIVFKLSGDEEFINFKELRLRVFKSNFSNISLISWLSMLLLEVIGVPG